MEDNKIEEVKQEVEQTEQIVKDSVKLAKNVASGNFLGAAKDALNLLKNENFKKQIKKKIKMFVIKFLLVIIIIVTIAGIFLGITNAVKEKMEALLAELGDYTTNLWTWLTDDYWIDIDKKVKVTAEDGTEKEQTIVDHYMEQLGSLGISLKDLRLLGEADYSDPNLLDDEDNKELVQKYLKEFIRADIISQEIHRQNNGTNLVKPDDEDKIDGGVYLYRTKNEITKEGVVEVDDDTTFRMKFTEYDKFIEYGQKTSPDYNKAREMFTIDTETKELLFYKVDQITEYEYEYNYVMNNNQPNYEELDPTTELTLQRVDYRSLIGKYTMPFEFLVDLCMITQNPEFVYHVAYLARNTRIDLVILDSIYEEEHIEESKGDVNVYLGDELKYSEENAIVSGYIYRSRVDTPNLVVGIVNTWSHIAAYKYTNRIINNKQNEVVSVGDRSYNQDEKIEGQNFTFKVELKNIQKTINKSKKSNEYGQAIALDETRKSKQFLGLLRNSTGNCYDETSIQNCTDNAEFIKSGLNVRYRIPNTNRKEMPLSKLQSGKEMLYRLLEMQNSTNLYNQKMQGIKEYMQWIMTFPENENINLTDEDIEDLLKNGNNNNVTYGIFWWPLDPNADARISSFFGPRRAPIEGASTNHGAIDIAVVTGTDVLASADGIVDYVGYDEDGYGNYITIDHKNGYKTRYAHNSQILVRKGDTVTRGQVIAKSGSTGNSTGPHLHFEIILNGTKVDPLDYVSITNKQPTSGTYPISDAEKLDVIYAVVAQECNTSYEGALAVITCVLNRCESPAWRNYGGNDPYRQITWPSQFAYSVEVDRNQNYKRYLDGNAPSCVKQAVDDALNKGIRNHNYTRFRTDTEECRRNHPNGQDIGGNWYF